ncbi:MAG TPA: ATP-binding cassette domain-containing protein [Burkholderiales bacterium]|nr:ATP-binding cassette domain-containing protein [Burkholderiales bacterium]
MITLENVSKSYGKQLVLAPTSLQFERGKVCALIGPSGCGKSTLLRLMLGLIEPDTGRVIFGGEPLTADNVQHVRHSIGYVIQDGGLFPHLTARENVVLLAHFLQRNPSWIEQRVNDLSELVRLPRNALSHYPGELSGGQRQRIGLMRALMLDPQVLLLDEPLGALDPIVRGELQRELKGIFTHLGKTVILVTHDMNEAAYLALDIVLLREGQVVQRGTLNDLLHHPAEPYVTQFIKSQRPMTAELL